MKFDDAIFLNIYLINYKLLMKHHLKLSRIAQNKGYGFLQLHKLSRLSNKYNNA